MLRVLGLDPATEAVYRLMLAHPAWGVDALAEAAGLDRPAVLAALDRLADLALLRTSSADAADGEGPDDGRPRLASPHLALDALLARRQAEVARTQMEVEASRAAVAGLLADYAALASGSGAAVERLSDADAVQRRLEELLYTADHEVLAFLPKGPRDTACWQLPQPLARTLLERGVRLRVMHLDSAAGTAVAKAYAHRLGQLGGAVRTVPSLPMHLYLVDGRTALFPLAPRDPDQGALVIEEPGALVGLCTLFDHLWSDGTAFGSGNEVGADGCSPQERALLRLLADGSTDEAAARRLGISLRTERRMITSLSQRFGAHSRFQLGRQAVERGLL